MPAPPPPLADPSSNSISHERFCQDEWTAARTARERERASSLRAKTLACQWHTDPRRRETSGREVTGFVNDEFIWGCNTCRRNVRRSVRGRALTFYIVESVSAREDTESKMNSLEGILARERTQARNPRRSREARIPRRTLKRDCALKR